MRSAYHAGGSAKSHPHPWVDPPLGRKGEEDPCEAYDESDEGIDDVVIRGEDDGRHLEPREGDAQRAQGRMPHGYHHCAADHHCPSEVQAGNRRVGVDERGHRLRLVAQVVVLFDRADEFAGSGDENLVTAMKTLLGHVSRGRTAPIHDHLKGRKSEMEYISGVVARKGKELGIPTPCNDAVVEIDRQINTGQIKMDRSNFELLKSKVGGNQF